MVEIHEAADHDVPELARVHVQADWDTYAPLFGAEARMLDATNSEQRWRQALRDGGVLLVAVADEAIVGFGCGHEDRICALYLLATYHRQGIGTAILRKLLRTLHERGVSEARFDVVAKNAQAIAFYSAQGARLLGRCVNKDPRGDTEDLIFTIATAPA